MPFSQRLQYYRRVFAAYLTNKPSQLTFWHEVPELNDRASPDALGEYYMSFRPKADYRGPYDAAGVPLLNYHGVIGCQYNPIAIAQYGLGNFNLYRQTGDDLRLERCRDAAEWLVAHLEHNQQGLWVWHHHFDWEYRTTLRAPWYSGLAQGQGISLLVRAVGNTGHPAYADAAERAFAAFLKSMDEGGVAYLDESDDLWFEEYIVAPPTHILNGFIWASWGVYDFYLASGAPAARDLFERAVQTLRRHLPRYDTGFWSLYEQSGTWLPMLASPFYHHLHIVQLRVLYRLTGDELFARYADRWEGYRQRWLNRSRAVAQKALFKLCYY